MNRLEAIKATRNGAVAACISGTLTLVAFLFATLSNTKGMLGIWNDPSVIFDALLIFTCAYGVYKKSRFAAIFLFCYFIFAKIAIGIEAGKASGVGVAIFFLYFYAKATQGAFAYHKIERAENPSYKVTPKWVYYTGIPFALIFFVLMGAGILTMTGVLPSTEVQAGSKVSQRDKDALISNEVISKDDHIEYFYSGGIASILEGGAILAADRVILYLPDENQNLKVYEMYCNDVASVELIEAGNYMNNSVYKINSRKPGAWLQIALSTEKRGDIKFIEALRSKIAAVSP